MGWSTHQMKRESPEASVLGIDLSERAIALACRMFGQSGITFGAHMTSQSGQISCIHQDCRAKLHSVWRHALSEQGSITLSYPSPLHQRYLRQHCPQGLQPVDEDVTSVDMMRLANDMGGVLVYQRQVDVWRLGDYVHAVVERRPVYAAVPSSPAYSVIRAEQRQRQKLVNSRLGAHDTESGWVLPEGQGPVLCIVRPENDAYSQTFIRAHAELLPAEIRLLHGGWFPTQTDTGQSLLSLSEHALAMVLGKTLGVDLKAFQDRALRRYLRRNKVQAVLAEFGPTGACIAKACQAQDVPLIVHFHGADAYAVSVLEEYAAAYRYMFRQAAAIVVVSRDMEQQLLTLGADPEKLFYNPCGVDTRLFSGAEPSAVPPTFLAAGRFVDKKAPYLTLLAFRSVVAVCPDARLVMLGDGPLWEACKHLAHGLGVAGAVEFRGPRSQTEVAQAMRTARAFVQHSIRTTSGDSEGTPVAVLEAGAAGLAVVATRHGGIRDVVIEGETGLLVDEGDVGRMAECMIQLARDAEMAALLGRAAREHVLAYYSMERSIGGLWRIIEDAIGERERRARTGISA